MARQRKLCAMKEQQSTDEKAENGSERSSSDNSGDDSEEGSDDERMNRKEWLAVYRKQGAYSSEEDEVD